MTPAPSGSYLLAGRLSLVLMLGLLAACANGQNPFLRGAAAGGNGDAVPVSNAKSVKLVDRDVEAPDVFQVEDSALWDGRPSLGGVWVASPDAIDPERVIMRNMANGKFVIGALFKRERDNPGPSLQISSDAAAALGMLAGQPASISVTALRREEAPAQVDATRPPLDAAETVQDEMPTGAATAPQIMPVIGGAQANAVTTSPLASPATATAVPAAPAAAGPYIQIGIFSVQANAQRAVATLNAAGVAAQMRNDTAKGKPYWSVGAFGDAATLAKIKAAGFKDAYVPKG